MTRHLKKSKKEYIWRRDNMICYLCFKDLDENNRTVDHIVARSKGGSDDYKNLISCCRECNLNKSRNYENN